MHKVRVMKRNQGQGRIKIKNLFFKQAYDIHIQLPFFLLKTNIHKRVAKSRENKIDDPKQN